MAILHVPWHKEMVSRAVLLGAEEDEGTGHLMRRGGDRELSRNCLVCSLVEGHLFSFAQNHSW